MAEVYISKSIFPNKAFSAFISCVSKHSLKEEFSSAVLREAPLLPHFREGKACLTLLHLSVLLHPFSFLEGSRLWGFRIFFVTALVCSAVLQRREKVWLHPCTKGAAGWGPEAAPRTKKGGLKTPPSRIKARSWSRAVITADELKRKSAIKKKTKGRGRGRQSQCRFCMVGLLIKAHPQQGNSWKLLWWARAFWLCWVQELQGLIFTKCPQWLQAYEVLLDFLHFHLLNCIEKPGFEIQLGCNFYCKCNYKCKVSKYISQVINSKPGTVLSWWNISCPDLSHVLIKLI